MEPTRGDLRLSQRKPSACKECSKRKVRCDKKIPCSRCIRYSRDCSREVVQITKSFGVNRDELDFLHSLVDDAENGMEVERLIAALRGRIRLLEHGASEPQDGATATTPASPLSPSRQQTRQVSTTRSPQADSVASSLQVLDANRLRAVEFLAWGRYSEACYPHRDCGCRSFRPYAEIASINVDPAWLGMRRTRVELPPDLHLPEDVARYLVRFHFSDIFWHHNAFHTPTFLAQCEEFWLSGTVQHGLWLALYHAVLAVSLWTALGTDTLKNRLSLNESKIKGHFMAMVQTLYDGDFLQNPSLFSIQAVVISTRVAHNIGMSDLNAVLVGASVRIAHCLGIHRIEDKLDPSPGHTPKEWYRTVETEVGRRCWLQLVIQDHFQIPFTDTYMINPRHYSTSLPGNCRDEEMIDLDDSLPTTSSYPRALSQIASLIPPLLDGLGPMRSRRPLEDVYKTIISTDNALRTLIKEIPPFLLQVSSDEPESPIWLRTARRSLAITAADKIIMIHRPVLFESFQNTALARTRSTCIAAALTILRQYEAAIADNALSMWTFSAFCVTAIMVVGLELLFRANHVDRDAQDLRQTLAKAGTRLRERRCDVIAERGAALIDTVLAAEEDLVLRLMRVPLHDESIEEYQRKVIVGMIGSHEIMSKFLALRPDACKSNSAIADLFPVHHETGSIQTPHFDFLEGEDTVLDLWPQGSTW